MVSHGVLPSKEIIVWRLAYGKPFQTPDTHKIVVFTHFFYSGFALPISNFFRGLLDFYGINIYHLNPNSILHIAVFIHLCKAFLGIHPYFMLFRCILFLKAQPDKNNPCLVGGSGLQLRGSLARKFSGLPFKTSNKGGHASWFYIQNPALSLPEYSCTPPVYKEIWSSLPIGDELTQANTLLDRLLQIKEQGLQGEQVTRQFIKCRLAPIKERSKTAFEYEGQANPNHEDPDSLYFQIMKARMYKIFSPGIVVDYSHKLPVVPSSSYNPPPKVII